MSDTDTELTPREIWEPVLRSLGLTEFGTDPCSHPDATVPAHVRYILPVDGLVEDLFGVLWCNCPYSRGQPPLWVARCMEHPGGAVMLLKGDTATKIWRNHIWPCATRVVFPYRRIRHYSPANPDRKTTAKWPSALVFFRLQPDDSVLAELGHVVRLRGVEAA